MRVTLENEPGAEPQPMNLLNPRDFQNPIGGDKKKKLKFFFFFVLIIGLLIGSFCTWRQYSLGDLPNDPNAYDAKTLRPKNIGFLQTVKNFIFHNNNFLAGETVDRINILLLGMGGPGHDGPYLTDTNIIISVRPQSKDVAMISVPRDLGVKIDGHGIRKINNANAFGEAAEPGSGGEYARQIFAENFNLDLPYYVCVDFQAFVELINAVGGVTIDVPKSFVDTQFPGDNYSFRTVQFDAGPRLMDGATALDFARSRHGNNGEGSDFARSRRQQLVLSALKEKLLSVGTYTNPLKIQQIITSLSTHISTNLSFGQLMYLASLAREIDGHVKTLVLDDSPDGYLVASNSAESGYVLSPKTGDYSVINQAIQDVFTSTSTPKIAEISDQTKEENKPIFKAAKIELQNGTWRVGLASREEIKLEAKGFSITTVGNSLKRPLAKTVIYTINKDIDPELLKNLAAELSATVENTLPDWLNEAYDDPQTPADETGPKYKSDTDLLIILGTDLKE